MLFPIFIFKDKSSDYGVVVPGLPGCFSAGRTMEDAMASAREAIELHLEGITDDGEEIPELRGIDEYRDEVAAGGIAAIVDVDVTAFQAKQSERVNVTFPKPLLTKIDKVSERLGMSRSGFLQKASKAYISEIGSGKGAPAPRARKAKAAPLTSTSKT